MPFYLFFKELFPSIPSYPQLPPLRRRASQKSSPPFQQMWITCISKCP